MTNDEIKTLALANGFTLREQPDGSMDLNPYVYAFARALRAEVIAEIRPLVFRIHSTPFSQSHNAALGRLRELVREE